MFKNRLFTPGPTPIPHSVNLAMATEMIHHRHPEFVDLFQTVRNNLKRLFYTDQEVCILTGSGTAALEAIVGNFTNQSSVLVVNAGKFGERWLKLNRIAGNQISEIHLEWGKSVDTQQILNCLKANPRISHVFLTHSETSTGASTPVKEIAKAIKKNYPTVLICVDGITAVGAMEFKFDEWEIDLACTGSQKGLMMPPGLSFVVVSELAWKQYQAGRHYYLDIKAAYDNAKKNTTPYTPAISLIFGLNQSLKLIIDEGIEVIWKRHQQLADSVRSAIVSLNLTLFAESPSNALTAVQIPSSLDGNELVKQFKSLCGMTVAGGQDQLKGKIFRISHLGYYDEFDMITVIAGLEKVLIHNKFKFAHGAGVNAAMKSLWNS